MFPLLIFLAFCWAQILEPVSSLHPNSNQLFAYANENTLLSKAYQGTDELQLFQRGLENGKDDTESKEDEAEDGIPEVDVEKAVSSIGQLRPQLSKPIAARITRLVRTLGRSPLTDVFSHIRNLIANANAIGQYPRISVPSSDAIDDTFSRAALLVAVGDLSDEDAEECDKFSQTLKKHFKNTEMEALLANITILLENRAILRKYAKLGENTDKAFGLDKPFDSARYGLPVPTRENPVVYFQLKDDKNPSVKFLVKVKLEEDEIVQTILIQTDESRGRISSSSVFTASNDKNGLEDLYRRLPISKLVEH